MRSRGCALNIDKSQGVIGARLDFYIFVVQKCRADGTCDIINIVLIRAGVYAVAACK